MDKYLVALMEKWGGEFCEEDNCVYFDRDKVTESWFNDEIKVWIDLDDEYKFVNTDQFGRKGIKQKFLDDVKNLEIDNGMRKAEIGYYVLNKGMRSAKTGKSLEQGYVYVAIDGECVEEFTEKEYIQKYVGMGLWEFFEAIGLDIEDIDENVEIDPFLPAYEYQEEDWEDEDDEDEDEDEDDEDEEEDEDD